MQQGVKTPVKSKTVLTNTTGIAGGAAMIANGQPEAGYVLVGWSVLNLVLRFFTSSSIRG